MLRPQRHPLITTALLAAYLAAGMASGLLHEHVHEHAHDAAGCAAAAHAQCEHHHDAEGLHHEAAHHSAAVADVPHDDDCVVCRFLAQRVMPAQIAPLEAGGASSFDVPHGYTSQPTTSTPRTTHSRAPPQLG